MAPTRRYMDTKKATTNPLGIALAALIFAAVLGALILANIEIWSAIL